MQKHRNVFISFLGTTNYVETIYQLDEKKLAPTRFIQEALIEHFCLDWNENSLILIFCTDEAEKKNWLDDGQGKIYEDCEKIGLKHRLDLMKEERGLKAGVEMIKIVEGFTKQEMWSIFERVYTKLQNNDSVYFDITHAFRSIPMLATTFFDYAKYMKNVTIENVSYGAFEKLGAAFVVREIDLENRVAPIVDMTEVIELQRCVQMANGVTQYGRFNVLAEKLNEISVQNFKDSEMLSNIASQILLLDQALTTNFGSVLTDASFMTNLNLIRKSINSLPVVKPVREVLSHVINNEISRFHQVKIEMLENYQETARWAFRHDMLVQAYTFGKEYINRKVEKILCNLNPYSKRDKSQFLQYVNAILALKEEDVESECFKSDLSLYSITTKHILSLDWIKELRTHYITFNNYRNLIDHCKLQNVSYDELKEYFREHFDAMTAIVQGREKEKAFVEESSRVFINLTSVASDQWAVCQRDEALSFGKIIDLELPFVDDSMTYEQIEIVCYDYVAKIRELAPMGKHCVVCIEGELTLTCMIVGALKPLDYICVKPINASKKVLIRNDAEGKKQSFFYFRNY